MTRRQQGKHGRAIALGLALVLGLAGCDAWRQVGFGPEGQRWNASEAAIRTDNVASLAESWSAPYGGLDDEPIVDGGRAFVVDREAGRSDATALGTDDGAPLWQRDLGPVDAGQAVLLGDELYGTWRSGCTAGEYRLDPATGAEIAAADTTPLAYGPAMPAGDKMVQYTQSTGCVSAPPPAVVVRDSATGSVLWQSAAVTGVGLPLVGDGRVYVSHSAGISAYNLAGCGGAVECLPVWTFASPDIVAQPVFAEGRVFVQAVVGAGGMVGALEAATGDLDWFAGSVPYSGMAYADGVLYVAGFGRILAYDAAGCGQQSCDSLWYGLTADIAFPGRESVVVGGDVVYVHEATAEAGAAGEVFAFAAAGCTTPAPCAPLWRSGVLSPAASELAVTGGQLYVAGYDGGPLRAFAPALP